MENDEEKSQCDCCGYYVETEEYETGNPKRKFRLCEICANTRLENAVVWPEQCSDPQLYKSIGWIANRIIDEIRKGPTFKF